jgi:hypothetical protein
MTDGHHDTFRDGIAAQIVSSYQWHGPKGKLCNPQHLGAVRRAWQHTCMASLRDERSLNSEQVSTRLSEAKTLRATLRLWSTLGRIPIEKAMCHC